MTTSTLQIATETPFGSAPLAGAAVDLRVEARRFLGGLALASSFGLALGLRFGLVSMAAHAAAVPLAPLAVGALGAPAFYVGLLHSGLEIDPRVLAATVAGGVRIGGLVLAGLAPAMALLALSCEDLDGVRIYAGMGLAAGGVLGLRAIFRALPAAATNNAKLLLLKSCFLLFSALLALRVWWVALPVFGGAR